MKGRREKNTQKRQRAAFLLILVGVTIMIAGCVAAKEDRGLHTGHDKRH